MKSIINPSTAETPYIMFNPNEGKLEIYGRSIPENPAEFYKPLLDNLDEYIAEHKLAIQVDIELEYLNTSSSLCIFGIFKRLETLHCNTGSNVVINWYYDKDDEDMFETGKDYKSMLKVQFNVLLSEFE